MWVKCMHAFLKTTKLTNWSVLIEKDLSNKLCGSENWQKHKLDHGSVQCTTTRQLYNYTIFIFPINIISFVPFSIFKHFCSTLRKYFAPIFQIANLEEHFRALQCISMALCLHQQCLIRPSFRQQQLRTQCNAKRARLAGMAKVRAFVEQHFEHFRKI